MYIFPNTTIKLLKGVPLDKSYNDTLFFYSELVQQSHFNSYPHKIFNNQSYQRVQNNIRLQVKADDIYNYNYLMFQNTSYGNKWFYAFITDVIYINDSTSEIEFMIDDMQTWFFEAELGENYVEREHSETDEIGENLLDEGLSLGEIISSDFSGTTYEDGSPIMGPKSIVVAAAFDDTYHHVKGTIYSNIYSGENYSVYPLTPDGAEECGNFLNSFITSVLTDKITGVFIMPTCFVTDTFEYQTKTYDVFKEKNYEDIDGHPVRNNKLFTYPYNFLQVSNLQGASTIYKYEYFDDDKCSFILGGNMGMDCTAMLVPVNYKGIPANYDEYITLGNFPQCTFVTDVFKMWIGNTLSSLPGISLKAYTDASSIRKSYNNGMASVAVGEEYNEQMAYVSELNIARYKKPATKQYYREKERARYDKQQGILEEKRQELKENYLEDRRLLIASSLANGVTSFGGGVKGASTPSILQAMSIMDFAFMHKHITKEFAERIDSYFDRFGYATKKIKEPNRDKRPHWNYVQTRACIITGDIPTTAKENICAIYDNGITFWKHASELGDYSLNNKPVASTERSDT